MEDFYNRAYRIVTGDSTDSDHDKTNIHACLSHVLLVSAAVLCFVKFKYFGCCRMPEKQ